MRIVNFKKELGFDHTMGGFIARIESPKAKRIEREDRDGLDAQYHYEFKTDPSQVILPEKESSITEGLYEVVDICKWNYNRLQWNVYIVVVDSDSVYPVAEYLDSPHTQWVKDARKIVQAYFNNEELDIIELTQRPKPKVNKKWGISNYKGNTNKSATDTKSSTSHNRDANNPKGKSISTTNKKGLHEDAAKSIPYGKAVVFNKSGEKLGTKKIEKHNKKYIILTIKGEERKFSKENGQQIDGKLKIKYNLSKED